MIFASQVMEIHKNQKYVCQQKEKYSTGIEPFGAWKLLTEVGEDVHNFVVGGGDLSLNNFNQVGNFVLQLTILSNEI